MEAWCRSNAKRRSSPDKGSLSALHLSLIDRNLQDKAQKRIALTNQNGQRGKNAFKLVVEPLSEKSPHSLFCF